MSLYDDRIKRAVELMMNYGMDAIILTKPANMFYLTGDGRLCAYAMVTRAGKSPWVYLRPIWRIFDHWRTLIISWGLRMKWA